jgi:dTDP-4-amino-4,6-dideoxygalactose transaminase
LRRSFDKNNKDTSERNDFENSGEIGFVKNLIGRAEKKAILNVLKSGRLSGWYRSFLGGPHLQEFEKHFAHYQGKKYGIAVSSGTAAIHVSLLACGIGPNQEVLVSPYTHIGSVSPIVMSGAKPIFVDIEAKTCNIDPDHVAKSVTRKSKAIIAAHQCGYPCDMKAIIEVAEEHGLQVIEDVSQALGAEYYGTKLGSLGHLGCFSLGGDMTKSISLGEGGIIVTDDEGIAEKCRMLRNHGDKYLNANFLCYNYRISDLQAALGLAQLRKLDYFNRWQIRNAEYIIKRIMEDFTFLAPPPLPTKNLKPVYYVVVCDYRNAKLTRDQFVQACTEKRLNRDLPRRTISTGYPTLIYRIPFYSQYARLCHVAEEKLKTSVWIDYHRFPITRQDTERLLQGFEEILATKRFS